MTIRVKNKHLVLLVAFSLLALGFVQVIGGDYLLSQAETARRSGNHTKALAYYDAFIERYPKHVRIPEALYWSAGLLPSFDVFAATFFPIHSSVTLRDGGMPEPAPGAPTKEERYLRIREEFPSHWVAAHVDYRLAETYHALGDPRSEEFYLKALYNQKASNRARAGLRLIRMYLSQGRSDEALEIIAYCQLHLADHLPAEMQLSLGDVYAARGDYDAARNAYEQVVAIVTRQFANNPLDAADDGRTSMAQSTVEHYEEQVTNKLVNLHRLKSTDVVAVTGRVTVHGKPLAGVNIYANLMVEGNRLSGGSDDLGLWVTASDGSFKGELIPGAYEFGIRLNYHQAKLVEGSHLQIQNGEITLQIEQETPAIEFRFVETVQLNQPSSDFVYTGVPIQVDWAAYPGASEYGVSVSGIVLEDKGYSSTGGKVDITTETSYLFDQGTITPFGVFGYDQRGVLPVYLLNSPDLCDKLRITVQALDEHGAVLSSSNGIVFGGDVKNQGEIAVQKRQTNQAENLLLARKYDEAVDLLEKQVEKNPEDVASLWILARIYFYGTYSREGERDLEKSLLTLQQIKAIEPTSEVNDALDTVIRALGRVHELI